MHTNRPFNNWDALKVIALLFMFVDHAGAFFYLQADWLRGIGRGAAPIFLFLAGYAASYRFNWEIFILACLMSASNFAMGCYTNPLNILFTILLCRAVLGWMEKRGKVIQKPWEWFVALTLFALPTNFLFEYGTLGFLIALNGYMKRRPTQYDPRMQKRFFIATMVFYGLLFIPLFGLGIIATLLMIGVLYFDYKMMAGFEIRPVSLKNTPPFLVGVFSVSSHYSGYIYAIHLIVISWITRLPI